MPDLWGAFGKAKLQELIGEDVIERLETVLPGLVKNYDPNLLFEKQGLIQVFDSFFGAEALRQRKFRLELYNSLPPSTIDALSAAAGVRMDGKSFEQKVEALSKRSWDDREYAKTASEILELPPEYLPPQLKPFVTDDLLAASPSPYKPLKDYQFPVFTSASSKLQVPRSRFVVQMPTGSGKTRTAMELICSFLNQCPSGGIVVWLAHSEELCEQAAESFGEVWPHLAMVDARLVRCWGSNGILVANAAERTFIVGGFAKFHGLLEKKPGCLAEIGERVGLVVVDEAHKVIAPTYERVTKELIGESTRVVGLTATPGRSVADVGQNEALARFFFNDLITIQSGTEEVIGYLRSKRVLSHVEYEPLRSSQKFQLSTSDHKHLERFFDLPPGFLSKLGADNVRNVEIVKRLEKEAGEGRKILFFACSVDHSKFICALLKFLGFSAAHIDGNTPRSQRASAISGFRNGDIQILCNFGVLSTGFDAPKTDLVFISRPTASIVLYSQMIGRGLRGPAIGGTESCKVIDVIDNIEGFSSENRVYEYFDQYFDVRRT